MSSTALIIRDDRELTIRFSDEAQRLRDEALEAALAVGKVYSPETQETAVNALKAVSSLRKTIESARIAAKQPWLSGCRNVDQRAADFDQQLEIEQLRINRLIGDYQMDLRMEAQRVERQRQAEIERIEKERQAQLAEAKTPDEQKQVEALHLQSLQTVTPPPAPVRSEGQVIRPDWDYLLVDIVKLYLAHPVCVELKERRGQIKELIRLLAVDGKAPVIPGLHVFPVVKTSVRDEKQKPALDV